MSDHQHDFDLEDKDYCFYMINIRETFTSVYITSLRSTSRLSVPTSLQKLNLTKSFATAGVTCHKEDRQCKTSGALSVRKVR